MLTMAQRKRLAREARKLAMECVGGNAPALRPYHYCGCALGEVAKRAGMLDSRGRPDGERLERLGGDVGLDVTMSLFEPHGVHSYPASVFPLLALADALEETP